MNEHGPENPRGDNDPNTARVTNADESSNELKGINDGNGADTATFGFGQSLFDDLTVDLPAPRIRLDASADVASELPSHDAGSVGRVSIPAVHLAAVLLRHLTRVRILIVGSRWLRKRRHTHD